MGLGVLLGAFLRRLLTLGQSYRRANEVSCSLRTSTGCRLYFEALAALSVGSWALTPSANLWVENRTMEHIKSTKYSSYPMTNLLSGNNIY